MALRELLPVLETGEVLGQQDPRDLGRPPPPPRDDGDRIPAPPDLTVLSLVGDLGSVGRVERPRYGPGDLLLLQEGELGVALEADRHRVAAG
jgi:hypothetical protein